MRIPVIFAPLRLRAAFFCFSVFIYSVSCLAVNLSVVIANLETTSPALAAMRMEIAEAEAKYHSDRAWPNPQLQAGQDYVGADETPMETSIGIGQDIGFLWSQSAKVNALRAEYEAALVQFDEARNHLIAEIIIAANNYTGNQVLQAAADSLILEATKLDKTITARKEAGDASRYDEARLQMELLRFKQQRYELFVSNQEIIRKLTSATGISGDKLEDLKMDISLKVPDTMLDIDQAVEFGLRNRGLVRAAELRKESALSETKAAKASQIPGIGISVGKQSIEGIDAGLFWEAGLEIPLFTQRRAEVQRTRSKVRTSEIESESVRRQVEQEIRDAILKKNQLADLAVVPVHELLSEADQNTKRGTLLYLEGELTIFELADALTSGYEAQASAIALRSAVIAADVELLRSVGAEIMEINND